MTWRYIASKRTETYEGGDAEEVWEVQELYYKSGSLEKDSWTGCVKPYGNSREELIHDLEMMLEDVKRGDYLDLDEGEVRRVE